jgi:cytidylate kinase
MQPVVTISAAYGTGGGLVAPLVAERLGVGFVDRAIPVSVAAELAKRTEEVLAVEEDLGSGLSHWVSFLAPAGVAWTTVPVPATDWHDEPSYKRHVAAVLAREAERGAVFLGRGAQVVLRDHPRALHVRLDGPVERRIAQAMDLGGIDERSARRAQHQTDTARHRYVHRLYHADPGDPRNYHFVIDATAVPLATCVDLIVTAVQGRDEFRRLCEAESDDDV